MHMKDNVTVNGKFNNNISYFLAGPDKDLDMEANTKLRFINQEFADGIFRHRVLQRHIFTTGERWHETISVATKTCGIHTKRAF